MKEKQIHIQIVTFTKYYQRYIILRNICTHSGDQRKFEFDNLSFAKIGFKFWKNEDIQKEPSFEINNFCLKVITCDKPKIKNKSF